ncbi:MAG: SIR2 family protein [Puniceicoccaceae bacterium]
MSIQLKQHLENHNSSPFLFLGSGFSRRYLGLEDWEGLLKKFSGNLKPYEFYKGKGNGQLPAIASLVASDFHDYWWSNNDQESERKKYSLLCINESSPIKIEISKYLKGISNRIYENSELKDEVAQLSKLNVDGVITTNWDLLCETLFPKYKVFVGQNPLLASHPHNIGEIYKIHGCCSQPNSLVLTDEDYNQFRKKQAYLAAKLITIFVEHPIIFIGYSLSDPNIISLLSDIIVGLGEDQVKKIQNNLIFIQRSKPDRPEAFESSTIVVGSLHLPVTRIVTSDFAQTYASISSVRRKIPARVLRFFREQIYDLVKEEDPEKRLYVVDYEDIENHEEVEFVVGVGVINEHLSNVGYTSVGPRELFDNLINGVNQLSADSVLKSTLPKLANGRKRIYLPVYKYLNEIGIRTLEGYEGSGYDFNNVLQTKIEDYRSQIFTRQYNTNCKDMSIEDLKIQYPVEKVAAFIPFMNEEDIPVDSLRQFLSDNFELHFEGNYTTNFIKLSCLLDLLEFKQN